MAKQSGTTPHTADLGFWVEALSQEELFESAASNLGELMASGSRDGMLNLLPFSAQGQDAADLLVQLLSEVVFLFDARGLITVSCKVDELRGGRLSAQLGVLPFEPGLHEVGEPVKAVTYHRAKVEQIGDRWRAELVLDV